MAGQISLTLVRRGGGRWVDPPSPPSAVSPYLGVRGLGLCWPTNNDNLYLNHRIPRITSRCWLRQTLRYNQTKQWLTKYSKISSWESDASSVLRINLCVVTCRLILWRSTTPRRCHVIIHHVEDTPPTLEQNNETGDNKCNDSVRQMMTSINSQFSKPGEYIWWIAVPI